MILESLKLPEIELVPLKCKVCKTEFFTKLKSGIVECPHCKNTDEMTVKVVYEK